MDILTTSPALLLFVLIDVDRGVAVAVVLFVVTGTAAAILSPPINEDIPGILYFDIPKSKPVTNSEHCAAAFQDKYDWTNFKKNKQDKENMKRVVCIGGGPSGMLNKCVLSPHLIPMDPGIYVCTLLLLL